MNARLDDAVDEQAMEMLATIEGRPSRALIFFIEVDGVPVAADAELADRWLRTADRTVARDTRCGGKVAVSTVFLTCNHNYGLGEPILYETMIFCDAAAPAAVAELNELQWRYTTREAAREGHVNALVLVDAAIATTFSVTFRGRKARPCPYCGKRVKYAREKRRHFSQHLALAEMERAA